MSSLRDTSEERGGYWQGCSEVVNPAAWNDENIFSSTKLLWQPLFSHIYYFSGQLGSGLPHFSSLFQKTTLQWMISLLFLLDLWVWESSLLWAQDGGVHAGHSPASLSVALTEQNLNFNLKVSGRMATLQQNPRLLCHHWRNALGRRDG